MLFHDMTYMTMPQHKNPCPGGHDIRILDRAFLGDHHYILNLSDICPSVDKKRRINVALSLYGHCPSIRTSAQWGHEIYNFGRHLLGHYYYTLSLSDPCLGLGKTILKIILHFNCMTYLAKTQHKNPCPGGHNFFFYFGRPFLGHNYSIIILFEPCPSIKFQEIHQFYTFYSVTQVT